MKVTAIIERSSDGFYSIYTKEETGKFGLYGYGDTPEEAKEDFFVAIEEMKEEPDSEILNDLDVTFVYDVSSFLHEYKKRLSISGLSLITGVHQKQLNHYLTGHRNPSEKTVRKIEEGIHNFANTLIKIEFA